MDYLFRGQRKENEKWVEGLLTYCNFNCGVEKSISQETELGSIFIYRIKQETVGQFTGLTDKNGKKIFEGDIVRYCGKVHYWPEEDVEFLGEICFEKGAFGIGSHDEIPPILEDGWRDDNFVSLWEIYWNLNCINNTLHMLEVVGNIHDNSELLGEVESCKQ